MSARKTPDTRRRSRTISCSNVEWGELETGAIAEARHTGRRSVSVSDFLVNAGLARAAMFKPEEVEEVEEVEPVEVEEAAPVESSVIEEAAPVAAEPPSEIVLDFGAAVTEPVAVTEPSAFDPSVIP